MMLMCLFLQIFKPSNLQLKNRNHLPPLASPTGY